MAYMQKPGRTPLKNKSFEALTNGSPLRNDNDKKQDSRFQYDNDGNQVGMRDTLTNSYYTPTEKGFQASRAKAEKIGRAPREFKGKLFTREGGTARGYQTAEGNFLRPNSDREWEKMKKQYGKDKNIYDSDELRKSNRRSQYLDYTGKTTKA
tara:strand:+ start:757 stop:1212 length:456 start_codon:yes stop_codon:yes gene_type:complete